MAKEAVLQVRIDSERKAEAESLFKDYGLTLPEAVRKFIDRSLEQQRMPFPLRSTASSHHASSELKAAGILAHAADPSKRNLEAQAWMQAAQRKHDENR